MNSENYNRESILFFDVAHEGAHVRSLIGALEQLEKLRGIGPRSIVILAGDQLSTAAAELAVATHSPLTVPVVVTDQLPRYVGALDIVMGVTEHADLGWLAQDLLTAHARGAATIAVIPRQGPLSEDLESTAILIDHPPMATGFSVARVLYAAEIVMSLATSSAPGNSGEDSHALADYLNMAAEQIDQQIDLLAPDRTPELNPARNLRAFIEGARILHTGINPITEAVARFVAQLFSVRGFASGYAAAEEIFSAVGREDVGNTQDIFHDPFIDAELPLLPLKTVIWTGSEERNSSLSNSMPVTVEDEGGTTVVIRLIIHALAATVLEPA